MNQKLILGFFILAQAGLSFGDILPVCQRTPGVRDTLVAELAKPCESITETDLLTLKRVAPSGRGITAFQKDDFSGLKNVEILNIRSNPFTELPEGLFDDLTSLKTLVIIGGQLTKYPADFLEKTPNIENLHTFRIKVTDLSDAVIARLGGLEHLKILDFDDALNDSVKTRLRALFPETGAASNVQLTFY